MAKHARRVMENNGVSDIVTVIQGAVEDIELPDPEHQNGGVDIIISEWMGYFLLRESMLDSIIRARDKFLKQDGTGLMFPSHVTMYLAPVNDEEERRLALREYNGSMGGKFFTIVLVLCYVSSISILTYQHFFKNNRLA